MPSPGGRGPGPGGSGIAGLARELATSPALPSRPELERLVDAAKETLRSEPPALRPRDASGRPGGLLLLPDLPTVLVPDIHGRARLLADVLDWRPPDSPGQAGPRSPRVAELLAAGEASLVCLGDAFHTEWEEARQRWLRAFREYSSGWASSQAMDREMALSLSAARIVLEAKLAFPERFHYLKGNHDNIANEEGGGDHPFYKFAAEGEMVASWFSGRYGDRALASYRELELELPVLALGGRFVASHGEPAFALARDDAIESRSRPEVVEALIWTPNGGAAERSVELSLEALLGAEAARGALWFAGHRPVDGAYALRAEGRFVQFHDPGAERVAYLLPGRDADPGRDILDVDPAHR